MSEDYTPCANQACVQCKGPCVAAPGTGMDLCYFCKHRLAERMTEDQPSHLPCMCKSSKFTRCRRESAPGAPLCQRCEEKCASSSPPPAPQREDWDAYLFGIARQVARRATCPRASIGVVLVDASHRIVATGYNGAPAGKPHCTDEGVGCDMFADHCVRSLHAEANAVESAWQTIARAAEWDLDGERTGFLGPLSVTAYIIGPREVCSGCARLMRTAGIVAVKVLAE